MFGKEGASGLESTPPYKIAWDEKVGETGCKKKQDGEIRIFLWGKCHRGTAWFYSQPYTILDMINK